VVICLLSALGLLWWPTNCRQLAQTSRRSNRREFRPPVLATRRLLMGASAGAAVLLSVVGGLFVGASAALVGGTIASMVRSEFVRRRYQHDLADILAAIQTLAREVRSGSAPAAAILAGAAAATGTSARVLRALAVAVAGHRGLLEVKSVSAGDFPGGKGREPVAGGAATVASAERRRGERDVAAEVVGRLVCGWSLSARYGVPWAALIETVSVDLADRVRAAAQRDAQVSGPRVSGYVLAVLPALGILLGVGMGADPVHVLFGTGAGHLMLLVGCSLTCAGLSWTARIVRG